VQLRLDLRVRIALQPRGLVDQIGVEVAVVFDGQSARGTVAEHVRAGDRGDREDTRVVQVAQPPSQRQHQRQGRIHRDRARPDVAQRQADGHDHEVDDGHRPDQHQHPGEHARQRQFPRVQHQHEDGEEQRREQCLRQDLVRVVQRRHIRREQDRRRQGDETAVQPPHHQDVDRHRQRHVQQVLQNDDRHDVQTESREKQRIPRRSHRLDDPVLGGEAEAAEKIARRLQIRERVREEVVGQCKGEVDEVRHQRNSSDDSDVDSFADGHRRALSTTN